jgi:hypothetical protein
VKCPVLLKPGWGDRALATAFAGALAEEDRALADGVAIKYWSGQEGRDLEAAALGAADRVVVYGGLETVESIRRRLPATTPLVAYHHRISLGAVSRTRLSTYETARGVAQVAARAAALFDQQGCVSPHVVWVEEGGAVTPVEWAELLGSAFERLASDLPPAPLDPSRASDLQQIRGAAEMRVAAGSSDRLFRSEENGWTVLYTTAEPPIEPPGGRTVSVRPLEGLGELARVLEPYRKVLQSIAIEGPNHLRRELADRLARSGITRVTTFRDQPWPPAWWRHDGQGPLLALVQWIAIEGEDSESEAHP